MQGNLYNRATFTPLACIMTKISQVISCLLLMFALAACATTANYQQALSQWQGAKIQELIAVWGSPEAAVKLPNGNTAYMYMRQQLYTAPPPPAMTPGFVNVNGTPMYGADFVGGASGQTVTLYCRTWFEVNPKGLIVSSQFQGNNCVATKPNVLLP